MSFSTLPHEVLEEIIHNLDQDSLRSCSTIERRLRDISQKRIFSRIVRRETATAPQDTSKGDFKAISAWAQLVLYPLVNSPHLTSYIRDLEININTCPTTAYVFFSALPLMTRLERLDVSGSISLDGPGFRSKLGSLHLPTTGTLRLASFTQVPLAFLDCFPGVHSLTLDKISFSPYVYEQDHGRQKVPRSPMAPVALTIEPTSADDLKVLLSSFLNNGSSPSFSCANLKTLSIDMFNGLASVLYERSFDVFPQLHSFLSECAPVLENLQLIFSYHTESFLRLLDDETLTFERLRRLSLVFPVFWDPIPSGVSSNDVLLVEWVKKLTSMRCKSPKRLDIHIDLPTEVGPLDDRQSHNIALFKTLLDLQAYLMSLESLPMTTLGFSVDGECDVETEFDCGFVPVIERLLPYLTATEKFKVLGIPRPSAWNHLS